MIDRMSEDKPKASGKRMSSHNAYSRAAPYSLIQNENHMQQQKNYGGFAQQPPRV
jgi:hypothetical protein